MAYLKYDYVMKISYSEPVEKCYFTIKAIPPTDYRQKSISHQVSFTPPTEYSSNTDSFGNNQLIGCLNSLHSEFRFEVTGLVETNQVFASDGIDYGKIGMYRYPYGKCIPGDELIRFSKTISDEVESLSSDLDKCMLIMDKVNKKMTYETKSTDVSTSAEEAFKLGKGVCQDFSHIYICLLRLFKIPARYVCGLIVGQGESHAWVEAVIDNSFIGFDPTFNKEITESYIKIGVGRDATDCAINRGVMWGGGDQSQDISVTVERII